MAAIQQRRVVITGLGAVRPLGNAVRSSCENLVAGRTDGRPDHEVRHHWLPGQVRVRDEGLRPNAVDRAQAGEAHRPVRAHDRCGGAAGAGRMPGLRSSRSAIESAFPSEPRWTAGRRVPTGLAALRAGAAGTIRGTYLAPPSALTALNRATASGRAEREALCPSWQTRCSWSSTHCSIRR
jgi:hypothetical protein